MIECLLAHTVADRFQGAEERRTFVACFFHVPFDLGGWARIKFGIEIGVQAQGFFACHRARLTRLSTRFTSIEPVHAPIATTPYRSAFLLLGRCRRRTDLPSEPREIPLAARQ